VNTELEGMWKWLWCNCFTIPSLFLDRQRKPWKPFFGIANPRAKIWAIGSLVLLLFCKASCHGVQIQDNFTFLHT